MNKSKERTVSRQLLFVFGILCALLFALAALLFFSLRAIERRNEAEQFQALQKLSVIDDAARDVGEVQAAVLRHVLATDKEEIAILDQSIERIQHTNILAFDAFKKLADTEKEKKLVAKVSQLKNEYDEKTLLVLELSRENNDAAAIQLINLRQAPVYDRYLNGTTELIECVEDETKESAVVTTHLISEIRIMSDVLVALTLLIAVATGVIVINVSKRLKEDNLKLQAEIVERKKIERRLSVEYAVSSILADSLPVTETAPKILEAVCRQLGWEVGHLWMVDSRAGLLRCVHVWNSNDAELQEFTTASQGMTFAKNSGLPGRVWESGKQVWVPNMLEEANFLRVAAVKKAGLKAAFFFPVLIGGGVGGIVEFFSREIRPAEEGLIRTFTNLGTQMGQFFERKRVEEHLLQSQKMETVGKLAGGVAHEFNSIMTAIIGQAELMQLDLPADSPLAKSAEEIHQAAGRAAILTRQLLAYGRKQFLRPEFLDLNRILDGMEGTLRHLSGKDIDVRVTPKTGLWTVKVDASQMEQVIVNMVMNAVDAMPNGGKLTLETGNVTLDENYAARFHELKAGDYAMLALTDTGIGMSEEVKARVFEPFFSTKNVGEGTGLGLSTCYGIVKQSGGHIAVYSESGRGATFKVYLPQAEVAAKMPDSRPVVTTFPQGTEVILLVEDDPALRTMASTLLTRLGYKVLPAADGIEALRLAQDRTTGHIDLLFTDVVMPHMSGKELSDRVRSLFPLTKILFTSAYTEGAIVHQGVLDSNIEFLSKPFTPAALADKIREMMDG